VRHQSCDLRDGTRAGSSHTGDATWCHNCQNDMLVAYRALGDSVDLTMDMIFVLCVVVGLNMCVECECMRVCVEVCVCLHMFRYYSCTQLRLSALGSGTPSAIPDSGRKTPHRAPVKVALKKEKASGPLFSSVCSELR
jgi:hypothetical protein